MPGKRGPKPKPAELVDPKKSKINGQKHNQRKEVEKSLRGNDAKLTAPKYLSKMAKKEYRRLIKIYRSLEVNILSDLDVAQLGQYCEAYATYQRKLEQYKKLLERENQEYDPEKWESYGDFMDHISAIEQRIDRLISSMNRQSKIMSSLAETLCITPVGRARMGIMTVTKDEKNIKLDKLKSLKNK